MSTNILEEALIQLRDRIEEMESIIDGGNMPPTNVPRGGEPPTPEVIRILEDAITRTPIDDGDLQDITDAATEAANVGYDPLQYHGRHDNLYIIQFLRDNPEFVPRYMDIYFNILGMDIRTEPVNSWLQNADESIRDSIELLLEPARAAANTNAANRNANNNRNAAANRNAGSVASNQRGNNQPLR